MEDNLMWIILGAIVAMVLLLATLFVIAHRRTAAVVAHLRTHGIDSRARVVDARRSSIRVNRDRGWFLVLLWRHPDTGVEHYLESDLIWRSDRLIDSLRASLTAIGELPVRVDPAAPERFHSVDTSSVR